MRFLVDPATGHLSIQVHDLQGNLLFTAPPSKALDVASGADLNII